MWDIARRAPHTEPWFGEGEIRAGTTARLPNGRQVLVVVDARGHLVVLDSLTLDVLDRSVAVLDQPGHGITAFPSQRTTGHSVATLDNGAVRFWDIGPLRLTDTSVRLAGGSATSITAAQVNGTTRLWVGADNGKVSIWNPYTGENVVPSAPDPHSGPVNAVAAVPDTPDGTLFASGGAGGAIILRDSTSGKKAAATLTGHTAKVRALAAVRLDNARTVLVSAGRDSSVRMWDLSDARALGVNGRADRSVGTAMTTARVGPDAETRLIVGYKDGSLRQHDLSTGETVGAPIRAHPSKVRMMTTLSTQEKNSQVATIGDKTVRVWDFESPIPQAEHPLPGGKEILALTSTRVGKKTVLAMGFSTGEIMLWNPSTDQSSLIGAHDAKVAAIIPATVHDRTYLVSADKDGVVRFWNPDSGEPDGPDIVTGFVPTGAICVLESSYGPTLAMGSAKPQGKVRRYDLANREVLPGLTVDSNSFTTTLHCLADADDRTVLVGTERASIMIWPPRAGREAHRLDLDGEIEASCAFGSLLVLSTQHGLYALELTLRG